MGELCSLEKLQRLIPHWIEHNRSHAAEFIRWADQAAADGQEQAAALIKNAAALLQKAGAELAAALEQAGGAAAGHEHADGHYHRDHRHHNHRE